MGLPYRDASFDTVLNTMALSGYPDGMKAILEMKRVLKPGGRLVIVDINYPRDNSLLGSVATRFWMAVGDLIRDVDTMPSRAGLVYTDREIGGFGSVHLYVCEKSP